MRMKKLLKSVICVFLVVIMTLGIVQASAFVPEAETDTDEILTEDSISEEDLAEDISEEPYVEPEEFSNQVVALKADDYDPEYGLYGGYDGQDSMDDPETAGSCVGWDYIETVNGLSIGPAALSAVEPDSGLWWIDDYYVSEDSLYDTSKTDDFTLKYQIEFHASEDLAAGDVFIVISASLGTYRNGNNIIPTDLGIPYGTDEDNYTRSSSSPFNYYYATLNEDGTVKDILTAAEAQTCSEEVYIVVWNYRDIVSGSNAMFQIMYRDLDAMQIPDMTEWTIEVTAEVDIPIYDDNGEPTGEVLSEKVNGNTLTGVLDTYAQLTSVTKTAYQSTTASYTPELYTKSQVSSFISNTLGEPYASDFDDYIYIVWSVTLRGSANQAYTITIDESAFGTTTGAGEIVGYKLYNTTSNTPSYSISNSSYVDGVYTAPTLTLNSSTIRNFSAVFYVVTAYPAETYEMDSLLENDVTVTVHPVDGYDADTVQSASATTTWGEYEWNYSGNIIGIDKEVGTTWRSPDTYYKSETYSAYMTLYELNQAKEKDTGAFPFITRSTDRTYSYTHTVDGTGIGEYREGSYCTTTTVDDALYVYPNGGTTPCAMLTKDDYYFSSVKITNTSSDYDVWEDKTTSATTYEGIDQGLYVYAMFYDADEDAMDEDGWEYVGYTAWNTSGSLTFTFSANDLARQPYRVKAVHSDANYVTYCTIAVEVTLRWNSPTIAMLQDQYGDSLETLKIENLCGVAGQTYNVPGYTDGYYFQDTSTDDSNYSEKDTYTGETLAEFTEALYDTILMRDNAYVTLDGLKETCYTDKNVSLENDAANGRVLANYTIVGYEGYNVTGSSTVDALKEAGISLPNRTYDPATGSVEIVICDLLPYDMQFNASATVTAGRITTMNTTGTWKTNPNAWSTADVSVVVEDSDVVTNWNDTGRTMVYFHIRYTGTDASAFYSTNDLWYEGFGISFQAYYDWANMNAVDHEYNIAAYTVAGIDENEQMLGDSYKDDGSYSGKNFDPFYGVEDLNGDGITDLKSNIYSSVSTSASVATASDDEIKKLVRADDDVVGDYGTKTVVANGRGYTYEISLTNMHGATLSDIALYDRLEYSVEDDRAEVENTSNPDSVFKGLDPDEIQNHWTGTFVGVSLDALIEEGADPVAYYSEDRNAPITDDEGEQSPLDVLTEENGWYEASVYEEMHDGNLSGVKAVAVYLGEDFEMEADTAVSFQIHMIAPEDSEYTYAFNNPSYYTVSTTVAGEQTRSTDHGDTVRVELGEAGTLIVEKEYGNADAVPSGMSSQNFTFEMTRDGEPLVYQDYMVYTWDDNNGWVSSGVVQATDSSGRFTLKAGQRAVFSNLADVGSIEVTEVTSIFWDTDSDYSFTEDGTYGEEAYYIFTNSYRSPVYLYKTVETTDLASQEELDDAEFTFLIEIDSNGDGTYDTPYANGTYIYVTSVLTNGTSPTVDTKKGDNGYGTTDANGQVTLGIGDIIVFFPQNADGDYLGTNFKVTEVESGDSWICDTDSASGTTSGYGIAVTITNYYKYRDLILIKELTSYDQDESLCEDQWTFRLTDADGNAVTGNHWYMIDADGNPVTDASGNAVEGYLDANGEFSFSGAGQGRRIVIEKLVMGEEYTLTETDWDTVLYETVNDGTADFTMPTYSVTRTVSITNKFLMRDLEVSKIALTSDTSVNVGDVEFTFILTKNGEPVAGAEYTIEGGDGTVYTTDENGQFTLNGGQTALFDDVGYEGDTFYVHEEVNGAYPQIYPQNGEDGSSTLTSEGGSILFINGSFNNVMSVEKEIVGLDAVGEAYVDYVKSHYGETSLADGVYSIIATIGVYDGNDCVTSDSGALTDYVYGNDEYPYVYILVRPDGTFDLQSYNGGLLDVTLQVGETLYIAEIGNYTVKVEETGGIIEGLYQVAGSIQDEIGSDYILVEGDVTSGSAAADGSVTLVNDISSGHEESAIYKLMTEESGEVPAGSRIVFRVEVYDASTDTWAPASGIRYITMDGYTGGRDSAELHNTSGILTTGSDGKITLVKTDDGYPCIRFVDDVVYANVYEDMKDGQLRIVELLDESDDDWGYLVGYDADGWINTPALDVPYADTFYDGNDSGYVFRISKISSSGTALEGDTFTFTLRQVISASTSPITSTSDILDSVVGSNVHYYVYDLETDEFIREGDTDSNGQFTLEVGQYAKFYVPVGTVWYFYEGITPGYILQDVTANAEPDSSVIDDTTGLIGEETDAKVAVVKYAVRLYGICADEYSCDDGVTTGTASLTFGAALGYDYVNSYKSCDSSTCIHKLSWDEIIDLADGATESELMDLFGSCLDNGCTTTVELKTNSTLFNAETVNNAMAQNYSGDGVSSLYYLLNGTGGNSTYGAVWNQTYSGSNSSDYASIYSRSRIRTTLTGDSSGARQQVADGYNDYYGIDTLCDETNCLFSCFPDVLQNAVVPRIMNYASTSHGEKTTYDTLWLPSGHELDLNSSGDPTPTRVYTKSDGTTNLFTVSELKAYEYSGTDATSTDNYIFWTRSGRQSSGYYSHAIGGGYGGYIYNTLLVSSAYALCPAFCIGKAEEADAIVLSVYDSENEPLSGAMFELYENGSATGNVYTSDSNGKITVNNLTNGEYYFVQVTSPGSDFVVSHDKCIENMTWSEIIAQAKEDPTVFYGCLDKECVKSVDLNVNDNYDLFNETVVENAATNYGWEKGTVKYAVQIYGIYADNVETVTTDTVTVDLSKATQYTLTVQTVKPAALTFGPALGHNEDGFFENYGVSTLYYTLDTHSLRTLYWNLTYSGYSSDDPANIYQRSRVRNTLTGDNSTIEAQLANGGNNYYYNDTYPLFDSNTCLFASFPTELQDAITPKAIVSDTDRNDTTTNDKLWLPSMRELGSSPAYDKTPNGAYTKSDGTTNLFSASSGRSAYEFNGTGASSPSARGYWSRSRSSSSNSNALSIGASDGAIGNYYVSNNGQGISPAFCIG